MRALLDRLTGSSLADLDRRPLDIEYLALIIAFVVSIGGALWIAYEAGSASTAELANGAFEREEHKNYVFFELLGQSERVMSIVLAHDTALHGRIRREVPEWESIVAVARAVEDGSDE